MWELGIDGHASGSSISLSKDNFRKILLYTLKKWHFTHDSETGHADAPSIASRPLTPFVPVLGRQKRPVMTTKG